MASNPHPFGLALVYSPPPFMVSCGPQTMDARATKDAQRSGLDRWLVTSERPIYDPCSYPSNGKHEGIELRAHVLNKALRKSPFIVHAGYEMVDGASLSVWKFSPGEEE